MYAAVIVALVTLAIAPVGALCSQAMLPLVASGHAAYARGLFFASTVLSVVLTPLAVEVINVLLGADVHVKPCIRRGPVLRGLAGRGSRSSAAPPSKDSPRRTRGIVAEFRDQLSLVLPTEGILVRAKELHLTRGASFWDALILAACAEAGVEIFYSEDLPWV